MAERRDPRIPKKNSRLSYIDGLMRDSWSAYRGLKEYKGKRESLTNLRSRIDEWLSEPELIYDLGKGPSRGVKQQNWSKASPAAAEFPWDNPGESSDRFFFFAYRSASELFTGVQMELDEVKYCIFTNCGYLVTNFEKIYATENETAMHFFSDAIFERLAKTASAEKRHDPDRYFVLADPAGHREGHTLIACSYKSPGPARKRAGELAEKFGVRFMVARVVSCVDTH